MLIPIRSFSNSKTRLAKVLDPSHRTDFIIECASKVLAAAGELPTVVITADPLVRAFAIAKAAFVIEDQGIGLNPAVRQAFDLLRDYGINHLTIAHGDLPLAQDLTTLFTRDEFTIVPDRQHNGTNVMSLPTKDQFEFSYGPMSFEKHLHAAERIKLKITVIEDHRLSLDIDTAEDYEELLRNSQSGFSGSN